MGHPTLITVFIVIAAVAIVIQMLLLLGLFLMAWKAYKQVMLVSREAKRHLDTVVSITTEVLSQSREPLRAAAANMADVSQMIRARAAVIDLKLDGFIEQARVQAERMNFLLTSAMDHMETTAGIVQRNVLGPLREFSALARGISAGLDFFLFSRRRPLVARETAQDEEMFI